MFAVLQSLPEYVCKKTVQFFNSVDVTFPYVDCVWFMSKGKRDKNNIKAKPRAMHIFSLFLQFSYMLFHSALYILQQQFL